MSAEEICSEPGDDGRLFHKNLSILFLSLTRFLTMFHRLLRVITSGIDIYSFILFVRVVFSWLPPHARRNAFYDLLRRATEPVLRPLRRYIPLIHGIDLAPLAAFVVLRVLRYIIAGGYH